MRTGPSALVGYMERPSYGVGKLFDFGHEKIVLCDRHCDTRDEDLPNCR